MGNIFAAELRISVVKTLFLSFDSVYLAMTASIAIFIAVTITDQNEVFVIHKCVFNLVNHTYFQYNHKMVVRPT